MKLTEVQSNAVNRIVEFYQDGEKIIDFSSPTGSGKTFIASNIIANILTINNVKNIKTVVVIATLSSSDLPKQMAQNLEDYKNYLNFKNFQVKHLESPSSSALQGPKDNNYDISFKENDVIIFGKSSFGKKRIWTENGIFDKFLHEIENKNFKLIYLRDEAHWGGLQPSKINEYENKFESLIFKSADFVIQMTATPKSDNKKVIILEKDLEEDNIKLVKSQRRENKGIENLKQSDINEEELLNIALDKFIEIKKLYREQAPDINPAILIQVNNSSSKNEQISQEFDKNIQRIIKILSKKNMTWVKYFGSNNIEYSKILRNKPSLRDISRNDSEIDVIIFKIGPATGWNIPRACMLIGLRNVSSNTLNQQTLGRIKRYPKPKESANSNFSKDILNEYFIYSNYQESTREKINYKIKQDFENETLFRGTIKREYKDKIEIDLVQYYKKVLEILKSKSKGVLDKVVKKYQKKKKLNSFDLINIKNDEGFHAKIHVKEITNNLLLAIYVNDFLKNNKKIFKKELINIIEEKFIKKNFSEQNKYLVWYVICSLFMSDIRTKYLEYKKDIYSKLEYEYQSSGKVPAIVSVWKANKGKDGKSSNVYATKHRELIRTFMYETIKNSESEKISIDKKVSKEYKENRTLILDKSNFELVLDSKPEVGFVKDILENSVVESIKEKNENYKIEYWSRIFFGAHDSFYFEYYDDQEEKTRKSYPDFLLKYKNAYLALEIKNEANKDINSVKSQLLKDVYRQYSNLKFFNSKKVYFGLLNNGNNNRELFIYKNGKEHRYTSNDEIIDLLAKLYFENKE